METKNGATNVNGLSKSRYPLNFDERNLVFVYGSFMVNFTDIMTPQSGTYVRGIGNSLILITQKPRISTFLATIIYIY